MLIAEAMNKYPATISKELSINEAAKLLVKYQVAALTVVDEDNKLIGIITEGDLLYKKDSPSCTALCQCFGCQHLLQWYWRI